MSDATRLPARPSLEQLQKQAKELLKQSQSGEKASLDRFRAVSLRHPRLTLADAQFVLAREYGFEDWAQLKQQVGIMRSSGPLFTNSKPPYYTVDWLDRRLTVEGHQADKDWDTVIGVIHQYRLSKVTAHEISDDALARLSHLVEVTHLNIAGSKAITDSGFQHLARMSQLQEIEFGGGSSLITDHGLEALHHLSAIRRFQACWTPGVTDAGLSFLHRCDHLEDVNLLGTSTGDGAIQALAGKPDLHRFQSGRRVTDAGLAALREFPVFKTWRGGEIRYGLMSADAAPNYLLIDGPFTDRGLSSLSELAGLFALSLFWHTPAFTSKGLAPLKDLPNLGFLGCQNDHCDDEAMRQIANFPSLRMLMGQGAIATDAGFEALSRSPTIEYIWGRECPNLTGRGFAALAAMSSLQGLALSCRNVDDRSLSTLPDFASLREFLPMDVTDAGFRHIGRCRDLTALWCMYCRDTGDEATHHIATLTKLQTYYAGRTNITDQSLGILSKMNSLERIELWQCAELTDQGIAWLADLTRLKELTLQSLPQVTRQAAANFPAQVHVKYSE